MRIRGSGKETGGFGGGWSRSDSFRRKHRLGQKVRGVLLKHMPDNMAWVEIDGDRLLAQLEVHHPEGARLIFVIKQLTPHIILKELTGTAKGGGTNALGLASGFDTARTLFENSFATVLRGRESTRPALSSQEFFELIAASPDIHARYKDAANCAAALSALLDEDGGRFLYQPWLAPECRRQVTFLRPSPDSGLNEAIIEFDHPDMGLMRAEFLHKGDRVACKLKVQHMKHAKSLARYLANKTHPALPVSSEPPLVTKLPQSGHGGIIAERLFRQ